MKSLRLFQMLASRLRVALCYLCRIQNSMMRLMQIPKRCGRCLNESKELKKMTKNQYFTKKLNCSVKRNKTTSGYQCVDLAKDFCIEVLNIFETLPELKNYWAWGDAIGWATPNPTSKKFFDFLDKNSAIKAGDLIVLNSSNKFGHICIATGFSDDKDFISFDQNMNGIQKCAFYRHSKSNIVKILRKK